MAYVVVGTGENQELVWVDDPVPSKSDPELPQPPAVQYQTPVSSTTTSNNAATTGSGVVPGTLDPDGRQQFFQGSPEYVQAEQIARQESREDLRRAARDYGVDFFVGSGELGPGGATITAVVGDRVFLDLPGGKSVDITDYFEGNSKPPVAIDVSVPTYGTTTVTTPFREVTIQALPTVDLVVNTSQGAIQVDSNSDVAKFLQWQGSQYDPNNGGTVGETWARQGISNPYSDPRLVEQALSLIERRPNGAWSDPNWPQYQGSNPEAFASASRALTDVNYQQQLKAENGWDQATFDSWALRSTNPEEWGRQAAAASAAAGLVVGPGSATTGLSSNGATVVTTNGQVNSQGFPVTSFSAVNSAAGAVNAAASGLVNTATGAVNSVTNTVNSATAVATAAIAGFASAAAAASTAQSLLANAVKAPAELPSSLSPFVTAISSAAGAVSSSITQIENLFSGQASTLLKAKNQATLASRYNQATTNDWRVRLSLAPGADYLYKIDTSGVLGPLFDTNGVIFPYMPSIETSYAANYDKYDLTHSNYRGYFYKGSVVNDVNIRATFTAQDTQEANYLLAVIHFFRSVTKMFYGQDAQRGAPPPLVFLSGLGDFQFNNHPCLVASFNYSLPNDVDYIRAKAPNNYGNLFSQRARTGGIAASAGLGTVATRLLNNALTAGATAAAPANNYINNNVNNLDKATYVPTKIELNISLLPTNTRAQVSQQFSVKEFANGNLIKGGFW